MSRTAGQHSDRRSFLRKALFAGGAALASPLASAALAERSRRPPEASSCILILLSGGVAQTDTWDPKHFTPFRPGMPGRELLGTCRSIPTAIPAVRFGEGLEQLAEMMDLGCVVRSIVPSGSPRSHLAARRTLLEAFGGDAFDARKSPSEVADAARPVPERFAANLERALRSVCDGTPEGTSGGTPDGPRVLVVEYAFEPFGGFDTHDHGARRMADLKRAIDAPIANLVRDLERRGLLDRTLVVVASEFGRTVGPARGIERRVIEGRSPCTLQPAVDPGRETAPLAAPLEHEAEYGFHAHFHGCMSALLFGGAVRRGTVWGRTADRHPMVPVADPISWPDWLATLRALRGERFVPQAIEPDRPVQGLMQHDVS